MRLVADEVWACPKENDYPVMVYFRDSKADYCLLLSRFSDLEPDDGTINVMVLDQIHTQTANLSVHLMRTQCRIWLDGDTAANLDGVREYLVDYIADDQTYAALVRLLGTIFQGLPGLTIT